MAWAPVAFVVGTHLTRTYAARVHLRVRSSFRSDSSCCLFPSLVTQHCLPSATVMTHSSNAFGQIGGIQCSGVDRLLKTRCLEEFRHQPAYEGNAEKDADYFPHEVTSVSTVFRTIARSRRRRRSYELRSGKPRRSRQRSPHLSAPWVRREHANPQGVRRGCEVAARSTSEPTRQSSGWRRGYSPPSRKS